ncbi:hypothetical protein ACFORJ_02265 [Corynebacterium hansenii]|uniref:Secreted protein n=1 Tax=Corynebacterium hansenii TaxID=394964 RepID=A0ABV7ZKC4_9CORY|nr:hypothetical protein [Corynebacterium hansenii]WJY99178.1 hypothetical protein CHAN_02735 [Corynebacterium hansenii]
MTQQWYPSQQPPRQQNGPLYALIALVAVMAVALGVVAVMAFGGGFGGDDAANVADSGEMQAPPAPRPTAAAPAPETVTETERVRERERDSGGGPVWGPNAAYQYCGNGAVTGTSTTSCPFAKKVTDAVWRANVGASHLTVRAYSPTTNKTYTMNCTLGSMSGRDATYKCTGGNNAVVFVGVAG